MGVVEASGRFGPSNPSTGLRMMFCEWFACSVSLERFG